MSYRDALLPGAESLEQQHQEAGNSHWLVVSQFEDVLAFRDTGRIKLRFLGMRMAFETRAGDRVVFYSSSSSSLGTLFQSFSAVGVLRQTFCQVRSSVQGISYEADAEFLDARPVRLRPMTTDLDFIEDAARWARSLPRVMRRISRADYARLSRAMTVIERSRGN
jgi:hypothetical protein